MPQLRPSTHTSPFKHHPRLTQHSPGPAPWSRWGGIATERGWGQFAVPHPLSQMPPHCSSKKDTAG